MKKKCKVIMLSVKKSKLLKCDDGQLYYYHKEQTGGGIVQPQHLYILSNEEIKDGDVWIENQKYCSNRVPITHLVKDRFNQKVIATTDKFIMCSCLKNVDTETNTRFHQAGCHSELQLPQIPESFIKYFVEKNGKVDEVEVEYEMFNSHHIGNERLKLTDNNEVITHLPENDMHTRRMLTKFALNQNIPIPILDKWIEENL